MVIVEKFPKKYFSFEKRGFRPCFWIHFPLSRDYFRGTSFFFTARCLRVGMLLWKQWHAILWFPYKAESACVLMGFRVKLMFSGKLEGLFFLKNWFRISDSHGWKWFCQSVFVVLRSLEVNGISIAVKCELLAVLTKLKESIFSIPSRKSDLLFLAYQKLGLKCIQSQAWLFPLIVQTAPLSQGPGRCDIRGGISASTIRKNGRTCVMLERP